MEESNSSDHFFIDRLTRIVMDNLSRESFDVEELARDAHMSRSSIHRRLEHLGKRNASHFIREIRLGKAREMLHDDLITAAEVAYKVGFGSPAYFSKCFHEYYGYPPGAERRRTGKEEPDKHESSAIEPEINKSELKPVRSGRKRIITLSAFTVITAAIIIVLASGLMRRCQRFDISRDGLVSSLKYYELAIAEDSSFAEAYAGIANAWYNLSARGWYNPYQEGIENSREYFSRALELDPGCAEAHALRGVWLAYPERKFEESKAEIKTALRLDPNFSTAQQWYAQVLMITGPIDQAREQVDRAVELEPFFWVVHNLSAWIYYFEEDYEKGLAACNTARDLNPDFDILRSDPRFLEVIEKAGLGPYNIRPPR